MKEIYNEESKLKSQKYNRENKILKCLNLSKFLYYLEKEDILNLSHVSKSTYSFMRKKHFLLRNLLYTSKVE
jgi:hypothetical protein